MSTHTLTAWPGSEQSGPTARTIRRTLLGLADLGAITEPETHADARSITWSFHPGDEDPGEVMAGLVDVLHALAPAWAFAVKVTVP